MSLSASETKSAYFGIGRRKTSVAKVILVPGTGAMVVNHKAREKNICNIIRSILMLQKSP
jgi:ribosomal protein S9